MQVRRSAPIFTPRRHPWRPLLTVLAFALAFGVVLTALVRTVSDLADEPRQDPRAHQTP